MLVNLSVQSVYNSKGSGLIREVSSNSKPTFYPCSFSPAMLTCRGCTQLLLARWRLHCNCILQNGKGNGRQLHCLRFLLSSRQMNCARDLTVLIKSLIIAQAAPDSQHDCFSKANRPNCYKEYSLSLLGFPFLSYLLRTWWVYLWIHHFWALFFLHGSSKERGAR